MRKVGKLEFCKSFVFLNRERIRFDDRPYLPGFYESSAKNLILRTSRQVEKSTFLVNTILHLACVQQGTRILFVCPRMEQARVFSRTRLIQSLEQSPVIRRCLLGRSRQRLPITNMSFVNGSELYIRAAYRSADAARGISADVLLVDEFQDIAAGNLPVLQETMSHSEVRKTILTGTPKLLDNPLDAVFSQSTAHEWTMECSACGYGVVPDERCLGTEGPVCSQCAAPIDPSRGNWVPRNPLSTWGDGYWINHVMVPWMDHVDLQDRRRHYDLSRFKNEVLGMPTTLGEHVVTLSELEACCTERPMARAWSDVPVVAQGELVAGIDWGGGAVSRTAIVIGFMNRDYMFEVHHFSHLMPNEDPDVVLKKIAELCRTFRVRWIGADGGGNGLVYNRLLLQNHDLDARLFAIFYSAAGQPPQRDGVLAKWTVGRSATIGGLFSRVKARKILFPRREECGRLLDEFVCEVAEYDDVNRTIKYSHPETQLDDALHATNYALQVATFNFPANREARALSGF